MGAVPVFSTIANPNQEIQQQREPTENQAVSSNAEEQVDDEDSDVEESNHPAFGDIPDNSIPGLLGHPASETPLVCEDPSLKPHGLTWTHVESISMDECTAQPKHTVINFPMGIVPDVDNIYSMWSLFFPYCIMDSCIKSTSERLQKKNTRVLLRMSWRSGLGLPLHAHSLSGKVVIYGRVNFIHKVVVFQQRLAYVMECQEIVMMKSNRACNLVPSVMSSC